MAQDAAGWRRVLLGDVLTFQRGFDITKDLQTPGPYPVFSSSGPNSTHNAFMVRGPGVIVGRKGSLGTVFYSEGDFWPHDTTLWVKDFHGNWPRFAYYFLPTMRFERYDAGASNPTPNRNHIHTIPVAWPPVPVQRRIAGILSAYDDLIENNRRRIQILEEMARALYREWFVEFRFPGHENVRRVASALGPIPEEWRVTKLSELAETQYGYTASTNLEPVGPKYLRGMDLNKTSYIDWSQVPYCSNTPEEFPVYQVRKGDVVVIRMADPGKVGIVEEDVEAVFASYLIRIAPRDQRLRPSFLFHMLDSPAYQNYVSGASTGTTRKSASAGVITDFAFALPPTELVACFEGRATSLRHLLTTLLKQSATLRRTRDLLLPRLLSGQVALAAA